MNVATQETEIQETSQTVSVPAATVSVNTDGNAQEGRCAWFYSALQTPSLHRCIPEQGTWDHFTQLSS